MDASTAPGAPGGAAALGGQASHGRRDGGVKEIKGLAGEVKEVFRIGLGADACDRGCGRDPASDLLPMIHDRIGH